MKKIANIVGIYKWGLYIDFFKKHGLSVLYHCLVGEWDRIAELLCL